MEKITINICEYRFDFLGNVVQIFDTGLDVMVASRLWNGVTPMKEWCEDWLEKFYGFEVTGQ